MENLRFGLWENYKITKPIRLIELFAGYGSQALALKNIGVDFEHHQVVEFDKYAIKTYNALHDTNFETQDITQLQNLNVVDTKKYDYIMTYSFPCTDLSLAGKGLGMKTGTRSGLLWEVERLLKKTKELPQVLLMENVTQVHGVKHKEDFEKWVSFLTSLGYSNIWQDLNAKDYGIPQNRNRTFMVSILGDYDYQFPKPQKLKIRLKDLLDKNVNEKYFISQKAIDGMINTKFASANIKNRLQDKKGISSTLLARDYKDPKCIVVGSIDIGNNESNNRVYDSKGLSPTLNTMQGGHRQPKILIAKETKKQKLISRLEKSQKIKPYDAINHSYTNSQQKKESRIKDEDYIESKNGVISTIHTRGDTFGVKTKDLRIRKLTPKECFRLMGLNDYQIDKAYLSGNSNAQLYKQAGNSIVVQVLERIFEGLL